MPGLHFPAGAGGPRWPSLPPFLDSVQRLRALPLRRLLPGHGEAVDDPQPLFKRFEAHHARRGARIRALLAVSAPTAPTAWRAGSFRACRRSASDRR